MEMQSLEKHVNFENENSRKAYYREFKKVRRFPHTYHKLAVLLNIKMKKAYTNNYHQQFQNFFLTIFISGQTTINNGRIVNNPLP